MPRRGNHQEKIIRSLKQADAQVNGGESCREHGIRIEETYVRVKGKWRYLYRALDSTGATIGFLLSTNRDAEAARRFLAKALAGTNPSYPAAHQHRQTCRAWDYSIAPSGILGVAFSNLSLSILCRVSTAPQTLRYRKIPLRTPSS